MTDELRSDDAISEKGRPFDNPFHKLEQENSHWLEQLPQLDWASTPLGSPEEWSPTLRTLAGHCLSASAPTMLLWSRDLLTLYNEAFTPYVATPEHSRLLGYPAMGYWSPQGQGQAALYERVWEGEPLIRRAVQLPTSNEAGDGSVTTNLSYLPVWSNDRQPSGILITVTQDDREQRPDAHATYAIRIAQNALQESEERLRAAVDAAEVGTWRADVGAAVIKRDANLCRLMGLPARESVWPFSDFLARLHPDDVTRVRKSWRATVSGDVVYDVECRIIQPAGEVRWIRDRGRLVVDEEGKPLYIAGAAVDITERKRVEEALRELNETLEARVEARTRQVRHLKAMLTLAEQRERDRIAQVLHDDLQQLLYALQLQLKMVDAETLEEDRSELDRLIERAIATALTLTVDLSPPILQGEGLDSAIAWLANQMNNLHNLEVVIETNGDAIVLNKDLRILLFQLVRELLFNVAKHAGTDRAFVTLVQEGGQLQITVEDRGEGFNLARAMKEHDVEEHYGLFSIRERLALLNGDLHIDTAPGRGTRVTIITPRNH